MNHPINLPPGVYPQVYRDKVPGRPPSERRKALTAALKEFKTLGCPGVAFHGFSTELPASWDSLAQMAADAGLLALGAFGLDDEDPVGKARRIASVAVRPSCRAVLFDAEGRWEDEASDRAKAKAMADAFRKAAPDALVFDQPWPVPTVHWSLFPWEEFADLADARAPQFYVNDWIGAYGKTRYRKCWAQFTAAWAKLNARLAKTGRVDPLVPTIQGYGWDDILPDLVDCFCKNPILFMWCEPFPTLATRKAMRAVQALAKAGFTGPEAVLRFQSSVPGLSPDGICGPHTMAALGIR